MDHFAPAQFELSSEIHLETILVVDDEVDWVSECLFLLGTLGYAAVSASTAEEAMLRIRDRSIATVIIDYNLPGCDGLSLIENLTAMALSDGRQLRVIMATGYATVDVAVGAVRAAVVDLLEKPVSRDQLQQSLLRARGLDLARPARTVLVGQLATLSSEMQRLSRLIDAPQTTTPVPASDAAVAKADCDFIRKLLRNEAKRRELGNGALFGDPAWDMLLDLLVAKLSGRTVSVSSACIASGAPTTTALRLVNRLVSESILRRIPDEKDGRRDFLEIDPAIEQRLIVYLNELAGELMPTRQAA